ncbi:mannose-1-phosphate guanyltransferase [Synechococcus elongatus]|uniref:mannose-1-phosphate guanyltransferase n=1 Tax=Synechococcus elongatus TaxID=32046 RepID=UPI0030CD6AD2
MRAVLLAGGLGTRLRPLTCDRPKPMVPILNRPIAAHILQLLQRHGYQEILATLYYHPETIQQYFQQGQDWGVDLRYVLEADRPLGTAGSVKNLAGQLRETFLVASGDCLSDFDLTAALAWHRQQQAIATVILATVDQPLEFGCVVCDRQQRIIRLIEKPDASELISDTVNSGFYILEPEALDYLPLDEPSDFATHLLPRLLAAGEVVTGYVDQGYWCDIGNRQAYQRAQLDALLGRVQLQADHPEWQPGIYVGEGSTIASSAQLEPPLWIGRHCQIGEEVQLKAGTVIGDESRVEAGACLDRAVIWNRVQIGQRSHLEGCVLADGVRLERHVQIHEGAVIGSGCRLQEEAQVQAEVRIWPRKQVEAGAIVNLNLIWATSARRRLFSDGGVRGIANVDITPEFAVKLGVAYGSTLPPGSSVTVSRDQRSISQMVTRSLIAGLMSAGITIRNLEAAAVPIARSMLARLPVVGGIHVRLDPLWPTHVLIEFLDREGLTVDRALERRIEAAFFQEDLRRVPMQDLGTMITVSETLPLYRQLFCDRLDRDLLLRSPNRIVIDYAYAVSGAVLPLLLSEFGCDAVVLNASLRQQPPTEIERQSLLAQMGQVVSAIKANCGVQVAANGERFTLVDEQGLALDQEQLTVLMAEICWLRRPGGTVVVPMTSSSAVEQAAWRYQGRVHRCRPTPTALMAACRNLPDVILGGSGELGFIFPELHAGFDAMFGIARLMEGLDRQSRSLSQWVESLPSIAHRHLTLSCPRNLLGTLMRQLLESHHPDRLNFQEGLRIHGDRSDQWLLVLPDASYPLIHLYANAQDHHWVEQTLGSYQQRIEQFVATIQSP